MSKTILTITLLAVTCTVATAQFGLQVQYFTPRGEQVDAVNAALFGNASTAASSGIIEVGLDYWLKPFEEKRLEFTPALLVGFDTYGSDDTGIDYFSASAVVNTKIYPMDFEGDCDCPTFSKDGNFLTKGLFLEVVPGVIYSSHTLTVPELIQIDPDTDRSTAVSWRVGVGGGVDIGVSDILTLSPYVQYQLRSGHIPYDIVEDIRGGSTDIDPSDSASGVLFGLRLGIRTDYK